MLIVHIINSLGDGGAEGALFRLVTNDDENSHVVISLAGEGKYGPLLRAAGIRVYGFDFGNSLKALFCFIRLVILIRLCKPSVVQTWLYHSDLIGGLAARLAGVTRIVWGVRHANLTPGTVKQKTILVVKVCAYLSRYLPVKIACCSRRAIDTHSRIGYPRSKFCLVENGYDLTGLDINIQLRYEFRSEIGISETTPLFGMVARFNPQKDHANLLAALSLLQRDGFKFFCVLVGAGMSCENIEIAEMLERFGLRDNVRLLGRRDDIAKVMNGLDLHILSSLGEAFPNVLAEAMACGTPCVTTDVGDAQVIVGATGWVVPAENSGALALALKEALLEFMLDQPKWISRQLDSRGRIVDNFDINRMVANYRSIWLDAA